MYTFFEFWVFSKKKKRFIKKTIAAELHSLANLTNLHVAIVTGSLLWKYLNRVILVIKLSKNLKIKRFLQKVKVLK